MTKKRVVIFTSNRAEYGLLKPLITKLNESDLIDLGLFVSGSHLSHQFGFTVKEIQDDRTPIWEKIEGLVDGDTETSVCKSLALITIGVSEALERHQPDLIVLLGDRYELLAAAQAATIHRVPIAHLHGGESSEGLIDEAIRHSITKMSHLHFVAADAYKQKVLQLGENPKRVFNVGALGVDNIKKMNFTSAKILSDRIGLDFQKRPTFLITYHPVTLSGDSQIFIVENLLRVLEQYSDFNFLFTRPNCDTSNQDILPPIQRFVRKHKKNAVLLDAMGAQAYLSVMKIASAIIGNSSSGLIEAPSFGVPTVNIGDRQNGRIRVSSVIDCAGNFNDIQTAIKRSQQPDFQSIARACVSPFGNGFAAEQISEKIEKTDLKNIIFKKFFDLEVL